MCGKVQFHIIEYGRCMDFTVIKQQSLQRANTICNNP